MTAAANPPNLPGLDLAALAGHLGQVASGPLRAELVAGGRSNLTYKVTDGAHRWVLRRPPLGHVLATAHDMGREYRVLTALAGSTVPVPRTVLLCTDDTVLGAPFYLMDEVPGAIYRTAAELATLSTVDTRRLGTEVVDVLARLHTVLPDEVGLGDFGRPAGYLARQVRRWSTQLGKSRSRELPGADELAQRLAATLPAGDPVPAVVHGDYRLDNLLVDPATARITAVLDWEMATVGDPLTDLALLLVYWTNGGSVAAPLAGRADFPTPEEVVARYAERSGRRVDRLPWYLAFATFKFAVILEGIHYRFVNGLTVGDGFDRIGEMVPGLFARAAEHLRED